jgi:thioredoxin-dependent peroxiredoxin
MKKGDSLPHLSLKDSAGKDFFLDKYVGKKAVVIYFYPKNFTPGCTMQACEFRDKYEEFKDLGAEVIGISADTEESHARFVEKFKLPFVFLSDPDKKGRKALGVQSSLMGLVPGRETFLFDKEGKLQMRYNNLKAAHHTEKALEKLKSLSK